MTTLSPYDLYWCWRRLPFAVRDAMKAHGPKLVVAGGYIRACIANEDVNDIDFFSPSKDIAQTIAESLKKDRKIIETDNAFTVIGHAFPLQFIHRWTFEKPADVIPSFDFTVARAAFWHDGENFVSMCDDSFYADLAAKRLVYCSPVREEEAGGSMLRVLKFYQRGYRIPLDSLGAVMARMAMKLRWDEIEGRDAADTEARAATVLTALLVEVDPNIDPEHICHLPSAKDAEQQP